MPSFLFYFFNPARFLQDLCKPIAIKIYTKKELRQYLPKLNFLSRFCNLKLFTTNPLKTAPVLGFPRLSSLFFWPLFLQSNSLSYMKEVLLCDRIFHRERLLLFLEFRTLSTGRETLFFYFLVLFFNPFSNNFRTS